MSPESPFTIADIFKWMLSALGALALWVASIFNKRLDGHEVKHTELQQKVRDVEFMSVGKDTYQQHVKDTHDAFEQMRKESIAREERIVTEIRSVRTDLQGRIDSLFERSQR